MKVFIIVVIATFTMACKQQKTVDYTLISGKLENYERNNIEFIQNHKAKVISVAEDGTFADTIFNEGHYYGSIGETTVCLYAINGAELNITVDANNVRETLNISGEKSGISQFLMEKWVFRMTDVRKRNMERDNMNDSDYMAAVKYDRDYLTEVLEKYKDIPDRIKKMELRVLNADYKAALLNHCNMLSYKREDKLYLPNKEFSKQISNIDCNDEELLDYAAGEYCLLLRNYICYNSFKMINSGEESSDLIACLILCESIESEKIRERLLHDFTIMPVAFVDNREELYNKYMSLAKNEEFRSNVTANYNSTKIIEAGTPAPKFFNFENHNGGTSSLDDFNGKYVYIDVWATWCGPCKKEIPHMQKVEEKYQGKNIEFVSISTDKQSNKEEWRKMVTVKKMGGVQLIASEGTKFMEACGVSGIPHFMLIDPDGNFVKANAPRPSDKRLIELFDELGL